MCACLSWAGALSECTVSLNCVLSRATITFTLTAQLLLALQGRQLLKLIMDVLAGGVELLVVGGNR